MVAKSPTSRALIWTSVLAVAAHWLIWTVICVKNGSACADCLNHWDSSWYTRIVTEGYRDQSWAFFPLYPSIVATANVIVGSSIPVPILGTLIATVIFFLFVHLSAKNLEEPAVIASGLVPTSQAAWFAFLLSPASYIFTSHHTEALFLLLSFGALVMAARQRWLAAAVIAGLASLTRVQGIFVAVAVAYWALRPVVHARFQPTRFIVSGVISGAMFSLWLIYQHHVAGNAMAFISAHDIWAHRAIGDLSVVLQGFFIANPWQQHSVGTYLHHLGFFLLVWSAWLCRKLPSAVVLYLVLSLAIIPWQGEFVDVYRFGAVLFPALYMLGEQTKALPALLRYGLFAVALALNLAVTYAYAIQRWAY